MARDRNNPRCLLDSLPTLEPPALVRALKTLGPTVDDSKLLEARDWSTVDAHAIYRLIDCCLEGSGDRARQKLRKWADHPVVWVAARALRELCRYPGENRDFLGRFLLEESRQVVLVGLLKGLYDESCSLFTDEIRTFLTRETPSQPTFYAAVLLKKTAPDVFRELSENNGYLRKIKDQVRIDATPVGGT